jgi:hypothetical protein
MALKAMLSTLDGLDEALKPLYKKTDDGKYALEVEGLTDNRSKLEEFRATNRALLEKVEELQKQLGGFRGLDPVKYKELQDKMATLEEKRLLEDGKIDEVIHKRTERMRGEFQEQLQANQPRPFFRQGPDQLYLSMPCFNPPFFTSLGPLLNSRSNTCRI